MYLKNRARNRFGKAGTPTIIIISFLTLVTAGVIYYVLNLSPVGWRQEKTTDLPIKGETLASYLEDPSTCASDLDKHFEKISLLPKSGSNYDIKLEGKDREAIELHDVDMKIFIPHVPPIAKGNPLLTHLTLVQRELNRNDTIFRNTAYDDYNINISNNCLRCGLWEAYITRRTGDNTGKTFHGWFEFPVPLYKRLFKEINGFDFTPYETALQHYQRPDGKKVDLSYLREIKEVKEIPQASINFNQTEKIGHLGEQAAKAKLVVNSGLISYADIYKAENQPIKLMQFDEPGIYKKKKLMKFDYTFLANPDKVELKRVYNNRLKQTFNELEIQFPYGQQTTLVKNWPFLVNRNGLKLVLGGFTLDDIPLASQTPIPAADFARFTFGVGTPDIYVTYEHRLENLNKTNNTYLFMLDQDNKYVDNHTLGLDQVYITRLPNDSLVLYLVSYERIMLVAHWNFKPPQGILLQ